jgi:hypothetical protein
MGQAGLQASANFFSLKGQAITLQKQLKSKGKA